MGNDIYAGVLKISKLSTAENLTTYTFKIGTIIKEWNTKRDSTLSSDAKFIS